MTKTSIKLRLRYVQAWVDPEGRAHHYFRRAGFPRVRLPGLPGSAEFNRTYEAACGGAPEPIGASRCKPGSVGSVKHLAPETQAVRRFVLDVFKREHGDLSMRQLPRKFVRAYLDAMTPSAARNYRNALRALAQHCITIDQIDDDPTAGVKLRRMSGDGHHTWDELEISQFEAAHPVGSRERLAFALGLYTGQRRADVTRMGRQHVRGDVLRVTQRKTGAALALPVHPELRAVLDLVPATQLTFLTTLRGTPFTDHAFSDWFKKACRAAGLPSCCTFHGLRKSACRRLAEAGCTVHEIAAVSGHVSLREVQRYTAAADQAKLARAAMARTKAAQQGAA
jgi:integrase